MLIAVLTGSLRDSGERRLRACVRRQLADEIVFGKLPNTAGKLPALPRHNCAARLILMSCTLRRRRRGRDVGCLGSMLWPRPAESKETKQPGCSQRNKPGNPNCVTRH